MADGIDLIHAIKKGDLGEVKSCLLEDVALLNAELDFESNPAIAQFQKNVCPLSYAVRLGKVEICEYLITQVGIELDAKGRADGFTPLHVAARGRDATVMKILLSSPDIDVNALSLKGTTPLEEAVMSNQGESVRLLLDDPRTKLNIQDAHGYTPLHASVLAKNAGLAKMLLSTDGVLVNKQSNEGETALHLAASYGDKIMVELFLNHPDIKINQRTAAGKTALEMANYDTKESLNLFKQDDKSQLFDSIKAGDLETLKPLIESDQSLVNMLNTSGITPLMLAISAGQDPICDFLLVQPDIDVNLRAHNGFAAIHTAALFGRLHCLEQLLADPHVDINMRSKVGKTPLHMAAFAKDSAVLERLLADRRLDVNVASLEGKVAVDYASESNKTLIEAHPNYDVKADRKVVREVPVEQGGNINVDALVNGIKETKAGIAGGASVEGESEQSRDFDINSGVSNLKKNTSNEESNFLDSVDSLDSKDSTEALLDDAKQFNSELNEMIAEPSSAESVENTPPQKIRSGDSEKG